MQKLMLNSQAFMKLTTDNVEHSTTYSSSIVVEDSENNNGKN